MQNNSVLHAFVYQAVRIKMPLLGITELTCAQTCKLDYYFG